MATNNVEGLQDALHGAAAGLATYNQEQGKFEIVGANLRRAQEMAKTLGVDYREFAKGAIAANERIVAGEILAAKGLNIDDKDKEFLTNMSQMKGGEMQITIPQSLMDKFGNDFNDKSEVKLSELNSNQLKILHDNREALEKMNPQDLARAQFTESYNAALSLKSIEAEVVKNKKNEFFGKNEYTADGINRKKFEQEGALPMQRLQAEASKIALIASKEVSLKIENQFTRAVQIVSASIGGVIQGVLATMGITTTGATSTTSSKFETHLRNLFDVLSDDNQTKIKEENERMKKWYNEGNGKDQRISFNNNLRITHIGLNDNFSIDQNGNSYLNPYTNWENQV
jgi:hypothetical protein